MARDTNKHHIFWPRTRYKSDLEVMFRELPCHIVELAVPAHDTLHRHSPPPRKPQPYEMLAVIRNHELGKCPCRIIGLEPDRKKRRARAEAKAEAKST